MRNNIFLFIIIILTPLSILAQDDKKLNKKEANEEVKRLMILVENLQLEKEEINNKLMIEYEKLLSEMDENSNLRTTNGELRSELRDMQQELLELQKLYTERESAIKNLNTQIKNKKSQIFNDSLINRLLTDSLTDINTTVLLLQNLNDSLNKTLNLNSLKKDIVLPNNYELSNIELNEGGSGPNTMTLTFEMTDETHSLIGSLVFHSDPSTLLAFNLLKINEEDCVDSECTEIIISQCFCEKNENGYWFPIYGGDPPFVDAEFIYEERCAVQYLEEWFLDYD